MGRADRPPLVQLPSVRLGVAPLFCHIGAAPALRHELVELGLVAGLTQPLKERLELLLFLFEAA